MKIKEIQTVKVNLPPGDVSHTPPRRPSWTESAEVANPMSKYPRFKPHGRVGCRNGAMFL